MHDPASTQKQPIFLVSLLNAEKSQKNSQERTVNNAFDGFPFCELAIDLIIDRKGKFLIVRMYA